MQSMVRRASSPDLPGDWAVRGATRGLLRIRREPLDSLAPIIQIHGSARVNAGLTRVGSIAAPNGFSPNRPQFEDRGEPSRRYRGTVSQEDRHTVALQWR
jgi:hypothetical protein